MASNPSILVLNLQNEARPLTPDQKLFFANLFPWTEFSYHVNILISSPGNVNNLIETPNLGAIIVLDPAIAEPKYEGIAMKLVAYAKEGGNVIIGGPRWAPEHDTGTNINKIFADIFGVPWRIQTELAAMILQLGPAAYRLLSCNQFRRLYEVSYLTGISVIYVPEEDHIYTMLAPGNEQMRPVRSAVAYRNFGQGKLGFIGSMEYGVETRLIYRALCNIPGDLWAL